MKKLISKTLFGLALFSSHFSIGQKIVGPTGTQTTGSELMGGDFNLTDHTGKKVTLETYQGKYLLVFFGFTHCPGICPLGLRTMVGAVKKLGETSKEIQLLFITIDPERDTSEELAKYIKSFGGNLVGLRGTVEETKDVADKYRAYYRKMDVSKHDPGINYLMDHSSVIYLMSKTGKYLAHFTSEEGQSKIAMRLKEAIERSRD